MLNIFKRNKNMIMAMAIVLITSIPVLVSQLSEKKASLFHFTGTDDSAKLLIEEISPNYKPWFSSVIALPSSEVASMLFCLQAAIGAGFLGYYFGVLRTRGKNNVTTK